MLPVQVMLLRAVTLNTKIESRVVYPSKWGTILTHQCSGYDDVDGWNDHNGDGVEDNVTANINNMDR